MHCPLISFVVVYSTEVKEMHDIFNSICAQSLEGLKIAQKTKAGSASLGRMTRPMFSNWFKMHLKSNISMEPIINRFFEVIASNSTYIDFCDFFETLVLLTKGEPDRRARCKAFNAYAYDFSYPFVYVVIFSIYDLDGDGVVTSHDIFTCVQMGNAKLLGRDILSLSSCCSPSEAGLSRRSRPFDHIKFRRGSTIADFKRIETVIVIPCR